MRESYVRRSEVAVQNKSATIAKPATPRRAPQGRAGDAVQRRCAACKTDEDERKLAAGTVQRAVDAGYGDVIEAARAAPTRGQEVTGMPAPVRAKMEGAFATDFADVRLHLSSARAVAMKALAFTQGSEVHVAPGQWAPHTAKGQELLGHELAHVVQQRAGKVAATRQMMGVGLNDDPALEREADALGARAAGGQSALAHPPHHGRAGGGAVQRAAADFRIRGKNREAAGEPSFIFFTEASSAIDAAEQAKIVALAVPPGDMLALHGYASEEGTAVNAATANARLAAVKARLVAAGHDPLKISTVEETSKGLGVIDYRHMRSVEVVRPGGASSVPPAPASLPCAGADETSFVTGEAAAEAMIAKATAELGSGVMGATMHGLLVRFFGDTAIAPTVKTNLEQIKAQLGRLKPATRHLCANNSVAGCAGTSAFNLGTGAAATMTLCPAILGDPDAKSRGGILLHEAAHGTPGLATDDKSYAHVRQIEFLSQPDALKNSDSYVLLVRLFDTPGSQTVGVPDTLAGLSAPEQTAAKRSIAWLETWLVQAYQQLASLYETIHDSMAAGTWTNTFYRDTMGLVAPIFGVTAPPPVPVFGDKVKVAAIHDRFHTMRETLHSTPVTVAKGAADRWAPGPGALVHVSPAFFAAAPPLQLGRLLKSIVIATPDISAAFVPKYIDLANKLRIHGGVGSP